jgi:hypothetical protein
LLVLMTDLMALVLRRILISLLLLLKVLIRVVQQLLVLMLGLGLVGVGLVPQARSKVLLFSLLLLVPSSLLLLLPLLLLALLPPLQLLALISLCPLMLPNPSAHLPFPLLLLLHLSQGLTCEKLVLDLNWKLWCRRKSASLPRGPLPLLLLGGGPVQQSMAYGHHSPCSIGQKAEHRHVSSRQP